jgi:signal transduction histidine kinase
VIDGLCANDNERDELLRHALASSQSLLNLINDVLDLARIEAGRLEVELETVRLAEVLSDVERTLQVQARGKGLSLRFQPTPEALQIVADAARLRQILTNVIGNAIKFTAEGEVEVETTASEGSPFVEIRVQDTGIGIPKERRDFLFKKFSQADTSTTRKYGGSGLGLVIVKELLEMMGGSVRVESDGENRGTTVWITLVRGSEGEGGEGA